MADAKEAVVSVLRPSETAVFVVDTHPDSGTSSVSTTARAASYPSIRRVLAVVIHESHEQRHGALFIYKWTRRDPPSLILVTALPISPLMSASVVRLTSSGSGLSKDGTPVSSTRSDCLVDIRSDGKELSFICDEVNALALEEHIVTLKKLETLEDESSERTHSWMAAYSHDDGDRKFMSQLRQPQDLRLLHHGPALSSAFAGDSGDEEADEILIRDDWVRRQIMGKGKEYSTSHHVRLRVGTFNVNGKTPTSSIRSWVCDNLSNTSNSINLHDPDILVFGFQELDLSTGALLYSTSTALEDLWTSAILEGLSTKAGSYVKFASRQLVGVLILAFVRKGHRPYISEITTGSVGIGIMGIMGNKGAVGLRFRFRDTVICFVASHLAANDGFMEKRNSDYLEICHRLQFPVHAPTPAEAAEQIQPIYSTMFQSDILIWMGDLNYRINLPEDEVVVLTEPPIKPHNVAVLMEYDELQVSKRGKLAFELFMEEPVTFTPTYRYYVNTSSFDPRRRPAWTDRILHITSPSTSLRQLSYRSHPEILLSDHKPVSAEFALEIRSIDPELYSKTVSDILKSIKDPKTLEKEKPRIRLSSHQIDVGDIRYMQSVIRTFELTNSGTRACSFRFLPQEEGGLIAPPWLEVDMHYGFLLPQATITISLRVMVNDHIAARLNQGSNNLEATLIVHPEHGPDTFIAISGRFLPTCFARSLTSLVHLPKSVRGSDGLAALDDSRSTNIPKELMRVIDWLMSHPLDERAEELFISKSPPELLNYVREALDTGEDFQFDSTPAWTTSIVTLAFGEILVQFLASLTEPVVPVDFHSRIASGQEEDTADFLATMPHIAVNVWVTLFAFLQYECARTEDHISRVDRADIIAAVFAPVLIRVESANDLNAPLTPLQKRQFVIRFLL